MLVDSTAGHSMLSFMDGFSGYSQILMAPEDMEKTSFITEWGTYCYRVMPFGLKNAGATYQRAATTLFHDMMHRDVEFRLRLNPKKCTFGVTSGKLLGYMVSERGIEVDPDKIRAILTCLHRGRERGQRLPGQTSVHQQIHCQIDRHFFGASYTRPSSTPILVSSDVALGCMLAQLDDSGKDRAIYYLKVHQREHCRRSLASLPVSDARAIDDDFPDEDVAAVTSLSICSVWHSRIDILPRTTLLSMRLVSWVRDALSSGLDRWRAQNQFADALATLASMIDIPVDATVRPLLIESRSAPAYCCLIDDVELMMDKRALRQLATRFVICGETLYRRSPDGMLLLCLDRTSADRVMREVHAGVCGPHMGGHMLARKIMRTGYFWLTMETDCCQFVQRCPECQIHGDLIHVPPSELHALTSPWPFSVWGIDIIGKISPKSSSGHEFILVAIDYFTKWVEAASYARLTSSGVASFIRSHIICRYGVPHELISDRGVHFRAEVDTLVQRYTSGIIDRLRTGRRRMGQ
ncbi:hypothetical protein CK203_053532 [Vitis vinifera]|uniref:Integrase catalytic domain-containing protein n=1 Tax=Vitis vinifera TaxID=29760 RepID=A0A438JDW4_VITVI|nr:hypothetical protein CK203_053532 [Vitis vinifera]